MMKMRRIRLLIILFLSPGYLCLDPFTSGVGLGASIFASAIWNSRETISCMFKECCKEPYVRTNEGVLKKDLEENVFGQHIVKDTVVSSLRSHLKRKDPKKALVFSFHGTTGTGKNFVSEFIAANMFQNGMKSKYVHQFISTVHFPLLSETDKYKADLNAWVQGNISLCERSLFIFDEIDKLAPGIIDTIKPYLDYHQVINGVDYRKSVFVLISNTGGEDIANVTLQHWKGGKSREELSLTDLEVHLSNAAFNDLGGLHQADIIQKALIDASVAFLPLEKRHVKMCIRRELEDRIQRLEKEQETLPEEERVPVKSYTEEDVDRLAEERSYWPKDYKIFSTSGCKKINIIVDRFLEDDSQWAKGVDLRKLSIKIKAIFSW